MADNSNLKEAIMRQVQIESNTTNVRVLMEACAVPFAPDYACSAR